MDPMQYSDEEARAILKRAVDFQEQDEIQYTRQQLLDIGREMGLSEDAIVRAEQDHLELRGIEQPVMSSPSVFETPVDEDERKFRRHRMLEFRQHFTTYAVVITFLFLINAFTSGLDDLWAIYPALGWGIAVAIHYFTAVQNEGESYELQFDDWREKRERRARKRQRLSDGHEESA